MYFALYITLIYQVSAIATLTSNSRLFSRKAPGSKKIRAFVGVSISQCERECGLRSKCQGVIYKRRIPGCILISDFRLNQTTADDTGYVLTTTGFNISDSANCTRSSTESCVGDSSNATECGPLPSFYTSIQGNIYTVASKAILRHGSMIRRVTCGRKGLWEADNSYSDVSHDCTSIFGDSGVYTLSSPVVDVYCDMDNDEGHWTVFQRRQDGTVDFLRRWDDYVSGFGDLQGEFWLGLEPLYKILKTGEYELRVDMEAFSGERRYAKYQTFSLSGQADGYRLSVAGFSGNAGDALSYHNGMVFSTIDRDNDMSQEYDCANYYKGAWWYRMCHYCNPNGQYPSDGDLRVAYGTHIIWTTWLGNYHSLKKTEMKFRRK